MSELKIFCINYFRVNVIFFYVNFIVWIIGYFVFVYIKYMKGKYGFGFGFNFMEGREVKYVFILKYSYTMFYFRWE